MEWPLQCVGERISRSRQDLPANAQSGTARWLGQGHSILPGRRQGPRDTRLGRQGAERSSEACAVAAWEVRPILYPSTKTLLSGATNFEKNNYGGRNFHFGIREHAMGSIINGMALSGLRPFGATFFIFSDYMRPVLRLAAMMDQPVIWIYTHDSFCLGEDGPTHQPIEHLMSVRAIPRMLLFRPADANEVAEAWRYIMPLKKVPVALVLTRQAVPTFDRTKYASAAGLAKGAYIMADSGGIPDIILMGTGSEVQLCVGAYEKLTADGVKARVVSMPCWGAIRKAA